MTKDVLVKQLSRDGPKIAKSFDRVAKDDIRAISAVIAEALGLISPHYLDAALDDPAFSPTCARLLGNAISTFLASVEVARHGYRRQYGAMARGIVESLSTVLRIAVEQDALKNFHAAKLKATDSISIAAKLFPPLGPLYGFLSNHFVHVGVDHARFEATIEYTETDDAISFIISNMRATSWLIYLVAELVFHDQVASPRYWRKSAIDGGFDYAPDDTERDWQKNYLLPHEQIESRMRLKRKKRI